MENPDILGSPSFAAKITPSLHPEVDAAVVLVEMIPPVRLVRAVETPDGLLVGLNAAGCDDLPVLGIRLTAVRPVGRHHSAAALVIILDFID